MGKWDNRLKGRLNDNPDYADLRVDPSTHTLQTIEYSHHELHNGRFYRAGMNFTCANGDVCIFCLTTPDTTRWCHIEWVLTASADGTFAVLEDVTSYTGGVAMTPINHNRNSTNTSGTVCKKGKTNSNAITLTGGTTIMSATLSTGKGSTVSRAAGNEFILKQNSTYAFRYTNGTSANVIQLILEWYEHTDKS